MVQVNQTGDLASIFLNGSNPVQTFTENDVLKMVGLTKHTLGELQANTKPHHLKLVAKLLGLEPETCL
jgi:hypothetical protein